jgi:hypothetical protein
MVLISHLYNVAFYSYINPHCRLCQIDFSGQFAALTREHGGWEQARLRTSDERSRGKALDEVSAAIPRDAVARNKLF